VGTLAYMAPEQAVGDDVDHRADIYSFGVMAYELLCGEKPFKGKSAQELVAAHLRDSPTPLLAQRPDLPPTLAELVMQCLEKDPARRPQNASELVDALEAVGPSSGTTATFRRMRRSRRRIVVGGAIAAVLAVAAVAIAPLRTRSTVTSLAVLPFVNMSGDSRNDFLGDGISEELIAALSKIPDLRVAARTSSFSFRGPHQDVRTIGQALGAGAVLAGSVRRSSDRLRVSVELMRTKDRSTLWSETYDRRIDDVLTVQEEIARAIVDALQVRLLRGTGDANAATLTRRPTSDVSAYELYLHGRFEWNRRKLESLRLALTYYDSAVAKDTTFALAYAGIADADVVLGNWGYLSTREAGERSLSAARRAVTLDSMLAEGHASLASVLCTYVWDWPQSEREFKRAITLNPGLATTRYFYARCLIGHGRFAEATAQAREAARLDPLNAQISTALTSAFVAAGKVDSAIVGGERALRYDPSNVAARYWLAIAYVDKGSIDKARDIVRAMPETERASPLIVSLTGALDALAGDTAKARAALQSLSRREGEHAFNIAQIYAALGDHEQAVRWLQRAEVERSDGFVVFSRVVPWFDRLRSDPRFTAQLSRVLGG
jgi:serine/threonine-protein kinase